MAEEYVSYDKYRAGLADFRSDMSGFREEVRSEVSGLRQDMTTLRAELHDDISGIRQDMTTLRAELLTNMAQLEVRLVRWLLVVAVVGGLIAAVSKLFP